MAEKKLCVGRAQKPFFCATSEAVCTVPLHAFGICSLRSHFKSFFSRYAWHHSMLSKYYIRGNSGMASFLDRLLNVKQTSFSGGIFWVVTLFHHQKSLVQTCFGRSVPIVPNFHSRSSSSFFFPQKRQKVFRPAGHRKRTSHFDFPPAPHSHSWPPWGLLRFAHRPKGGPHNCIL